jgi:flavin-dependent dehydrogenase
VGDAADFFDPFTGEGIYAALRGGELLSLYAIEAVRSANHALADVALAAYDRARRHEFGGKWRVERMIGTAVDFPWLFNRVARNLESHPEMADLLVGVTGDFVPPREVLRASFLLRLIVPSAQPRAKQRPVAETLPATPKSS